MGANNNKPYYMAAFVIQASYAGMILLSKAAFNVGMSTSVFVFYRQFAGTLLLAPFAIISERKNPSPLSFAIFCKNFLLAFVGLSLSLNIYGIALVYTSANLGATTINCLPVTTFALAVLLRYLGRMEKVKIRTAPGMAKVAGCSICFLQRAPIETFSSPAWYGIWTRQPAGSSPSCFFCQTNFGLFILVSFFHHLGPMVRTPVEMGKRFKFSIPNAQILKTYPSKLGFTSLQCFSSSIQSFLIAIAFNRDLKDWKLAWNVRLLSILYCGILVNGGTYYLQAWVVEQKGPVFLAMTTPLTLVMTILGSMLLLGEVVNLGSVLGGTLLVISLYSVLWGKSKEEAIENQSCLPLQDEENSTDMKETKSLAKNYQPPRYKLYYRICDSLSQFMMKSNPLVTFQFLYPLPLALLKKSLKLCFGPLIVYSKEESLQKFEPIAYIWFTQWRYP
ncbi:hypothetical protein PTKIN_Ptkin08bG0161900 [Pterospermum kingtungense]